MTSKAIQCLSLIALCVMTCRHAQAAEDIVFRTATSPEAPWVGQQVLLSVDVLAKNGWAQFEKIGDLEVEGAYVLRLETQGTRLNEIIDGDSYTGQRYEFMLYPQRDGSFTLLPVPVRVEVKNWGVGRGDQIHNLSLPVVEFAARTPPGAEGIRGLISTTDLTVQQTWKPPIDNVAVGDAIQRTVTLHAEDVSGMAFAPLIHNDIRAVSIYPGEPAVEDKFDRGDLNGTRIETVTYVFESAGDVFIPGIVLSWWDVGNLELQRVEMAGLSLEVAANLDVDAAAGNEIGEMSNLPLFWSALIAAAIAALIVFRFGGQILDRLAEWRRARRETEAMYFKQVLRSAQSADAAGLLRDTMRWLDRINIDSKPARLDQFLEKYGETDAQEAAANLQKTSLVEQNKTTISRFVRGLSAARKRWRKAQRIRQQVAMRLPELNGSL